MSTQKGVSRFDPRTETFRNYDVSDGLQSDEFSTGCFQAPDGEMFFGGSNGFNAFVPENVQRRPLRAAGRDHELHHLQQAGAHRGCISPREGHPVRRVLDPEPTRTTCSPSSSRR